MRLDSVICHPVHWEEWVLLPGDERQLAPLQPCQSRWGADLQGWGWGCPPGSGAAFLHGVSGPVGEWGPCHSSLLRSSCWSWLLTAVLCLVSQSCLTLCDPMVCSLPGSSVHGILPARILDWVAYPFSRGSSQPKDQTGVSCIAGGFFTCWATREAFATPVQSSPYPWVMVLSSMKHSQDAFDIIITDSSDPVGPAENLSRSPVTSSWISPITGSSLKEDGILCCQGEC